MKSNFTKTKMFLMKTASTLEKRSHPLTLTRECIFNEILVPTDFSSRSIRALTYAVELARKLGAHLTLLHVVPAPYAIDYTLGGIPNGEWETVRHQADEKLAVALRRAWIRYERVDPLVRVGADLHEEIAGAIREVGATLAVLSTHDYKGWERLLHGSDTDELLFKLPCPVLVVR
jgi:nucleotide-binding universal stress UspA family protein